MSETSAMTGTEFIRRIRKLGNTNGIPVKFAARRGKGSHGTLFNGSRFTIVWNPKDELKKGTLHGMLARLGLSLADF
jgi:mRNA interferase HicA